MPAILNLVFGLLGIVVIYGPVAVSFRGGVGRARGWPLVAGWAASMSPSNSKTIATRLLVRMDSSGAVFLSALFLSRSCFFLWFSFLVSKNELLARALRPEEETTLRKTQFPVSKFQAEIAA